MRTICIIGTDWEGAQPDWRRQPVHSLDRRKRADWDNLFRELGDVARVDSIAVGIRGTWDIGSINSLPIAKAAYQAAKVKPTLTPWYDTGALSDVVSEASGISQKFDFANPQHVEWGWQKFAKVFFDHFADVTLERTASGRVLCSWWHIAPSNGRGIVNQHLAQKLLDRVDIGLTDLGLGPADHLVDEQWTHQAPGLVAWGLHNWFDPWGTVPKSYSIRSHGAVTAAVAVPSFYNPNGGDLIAPEPNGAVLARGLEAARHAHATIILLEGGTDFQEGAAIMAHRNPDGTVYDHNLTVLRKHIELTTGIHEGETPVDAVTIAPLKDFVLFDWLEPGFTPNTFALPWREIKDAEGKVVGGEPDPTSDVVFSLQKDGSIATRERKPYVKDGEGIGKWESAPIIDDRLLVFVTEGVAMKVFGVIRGV